MDMEPATEAPQELVAALAAHGEALAAELRALDDMPQVKLTPASVFDRAKPPGSVAQQRGVICKLRCCGQVVALSALTKLPPAPPSKHPREG